MAKGYKINWTDAHIAYIRANQYGITRRSLFEKLVNEFDDLDDNVNFNNMKALISRLELSNGRDGRMVSGHTPWNKGKTGYMGANKTSFKKGMIAINKRPIGSERICQSAGYTLVKVSDTGKRWQHKHKLLWERHHGPIPDNHCIRFIDGNRQNIVLSNLICLPRAVHATLNHHLKPNTKDADLNKTIILAECVRQKVRSKQKGCHDG
ncbi:HNH endonuclease [Psychrobacter sp. F1192]|uniref:HNH endonuclease n=1 Tax=Psychrobacter coccoides TaxID=2818440 RepID=A0ABS3NJN1_9GAMM|nr:HNH endonuclease signature motif containing protein [Psychrobacter coccoides]MBO1529616.1 HNH endonuclease [Psychrobacter coccoides]